MSGDPTKPRPGADSQHWRGYLVIALVSATVLLYQVAITRILSVVLWYHFAYLAISLAMMGIGAPGVWYSFRSPTRRSLYRCLLSASVLVPLSVVAIFKLGGLLGEAEGRVAGLGSFLQARLLLVVISVLAAMLSLGSAVCVLLLEARGRRIGRMYGADLLGATVGALSVVPLLHVVPTPLILAGAGGLPLAGAMLLERKRTWPVACVAIAIIGSMLWGEPYVLRYSKKYREDVDKNVIYEKWTPTARLTVFDNVFFVEDGTYAYTWGMGTNYELEHLEQYWIEQDGSAGTPIAHLEGNPTDLEYLFFDVTSIGYQIRPPKKVCVIGAGGGRDILTALKAGAESVDAVELNGHIVRAVSDTFREFSGDVYNLPGVTPIVSEGRSYLTRSEGGYGVIQIALIDSWAATAAGAFALSENYLYTREAFRLFWEKLAPDGMLSVSRWYLGTRKLEGMRLMVLARDLVEGAGVDRPEAHLALVQGFGVITLLASKRPFDDTESSRLADLCAEYGFVQHWPSGESTPADSYIARYMSMASDEAERYFPPWMDIAPPRDDRPFFFQTVKLFGSMDDSVWMLLSVNEHSAVVLKWLLLFVLVLTIGVFFTPFVVSGGLETGSGFWPGSCYFASIGIAFMLVEATWVQRFILYLGHPSYSTTVVLAAMLFGAGIGSVIAARIEAPRAGVLLALPVLLALVNAVLSILFRSTLGWSIGLRVIVSVLVLVPAGFLMGFAFPLGMLRFGDANKAWFWAVNGAASVLATVASLALAMMVGLKSVAFAGVLAYVAAVFLFAAGGTRSRGSPPPGSEAQRSLS